MNLQPQSLMALMISCVIAIGVTILAGFLRQSRKEGFRFFPFSDKAAFAAWSLKDTALIIGSLMVLQLFIAAALSLSKHFDISLPPTWMLLVIQGLSFHIFGALLILLVWRKNNRRPVPGMHEKPQIQHFGKGMLYYLAAVPLVWGASWLSHFVLSDPEPQNIITIMLKVEMPWQAELFAIILAVLVAPVVEEILFRGLLLPAAMRQMNTLSAVVIVSFVFAVIHGHPPSIIPLTILGGAFSMSFLRTGSLYPAIATHMIFNSVTIILVIWSRTIPGLLQN